MLPSNLYNFYLIYDNKCIFCSKFISFVDKKFNSSKVNIYLLTSINEIKEIFEQKELKFLEDLQKKSILLILPNKKYLIKAEALTKIFELSNDKILLSISYLIKLFPVKLINIFYDFFSHYRKNFNPKNFSCRLYKPANLILLK